MSITLAIFSDFTGGVAVYSMRLAKALNKLDYKIFVISYDPVNPTEEQFKTDLQSCGVQVVCLKRNSDSGGVDLAEMLRRISPDIFIPNYRRQIYHATAKFLKHSDIRVLGICHNDHKSYYSLLEYYSPMISAFICPSRKTCDSLSNCVPKRVNDIYCIPHGVPVCDRNVVPFQVGPINLVYHGRLDEEQKYISQMLLVAQELKKRDVKFNLKLIGDGPSRQNYEDFVKINQLSGQVIFLGHLGWDLLQEELLNSHVALLTSKYEGYCYGLAEAMGMGLPAITFETGGVVEEYVMDGENGYVVPWGNINSYVDKVCQLHDNATLWSVFSKAAKTKMESEYSIELWSERMAELINYCGREKARHWPLLRPLDSESKLSRATSIFRRGH